MPPFVSSSQVELRNLLHEPTAQKALGNFAKEHEHVSYLMCWVDIEEFKSTRSIEHRRAAGQKIVHNYVKKRAPLYINISKDLDLYFRDIMKTTLAPSPFVRPRGASDEGFTTSGSMAYAQHGRPLILPASNIFDPLQRICFVELYEKVFLPFKQETMYIDLRVGLKQKFNKVRPKDFEYFGCLGEGTFGVVIKCRKKSTGMLYAMKIMEKRELSDSACGNCSKIDLEVRALAALHHPLIIGMDYSFQTDRYAFIAMQLATGGTIYDLMKTFDYHRLPEKYTQFFVAEIITALHYLHSLGMIYRDMKPTNVLIDYTGHIKLADLGGLLDADEISPNIIGSTKLNEQGGPSFPFARSYCTQHESDDETVAIDHLSNPVRRTTILGTPGYAAPEVVELLRPGIRFPKGYSYMADWWSLGVTAYVMACGMLPFGRNRDMSAVLQNSMDLFDEGYNALFASVSFEDPPGVDKGIVPAPSPDLQDLIVKFLNTDDEERLGYGLYGINDIQDHQFFQHIDWLDITHSKALPPMVPPAEVKPMEPCDFTSISTKYLSRGSDTGGGAVVQFDDW